MSEIQKKARELADDAKEAMRRADGESVSDKLKNAADRATTAAQNVGDDAHETVDEAARRLAYEKGRLDQAVQDEDAASGEATTSHGGQVSGSGSSPGGRS